MKKPMTPKFRLEIHPYECELLVLYKPSLSEVATHRALMGFGEPGPDFLKKTNGEIIWDGPHGVLILNRDVTDFRFGSILAHECCHIALRVFEFIGEDAQPTGTMHEPFCYLVSNVYQRVWEACLKIDVSRK